MPKLQTKPTCRHAFHMQLRLRCGARDHIAPAGHYTPHRDVILSCRGYWLHMHSTPVCCANTKLISIRNVVFFIFPFAKVVFLYFSHKSYNAESSGRPDFILPLVWSITAEWFMYVCHLNRCWPRPHSGLYATPRWCVLPTGTDLQGQSHVTELFLQSAVSFFLFFFFFV